MRKSWREKFESRKDPVIEVVDKPLGDIKAGEVVVISTPSEIDEEIRKIPKGTELTLKDLRRQLAYKHHVDKACPITTGIFLRIVSEVAIEEMQEGKPLDKIAPFWRIITPSSPSAKKLACGLDALKQLRMQEGLSV